MTQVSNVGPPWGLLTGFLRASFPFASPTATDLPHTSVRSAPDPLWPFADRIMRSDECGPCLPVSNPRSATLELCDPEQAT